MPNMEHCFGALVVGFEQISFKFVNILISS